MKSKEVKLLMKTIEWKLKNINQNKQKNENYIQHENYEIKLFNNKYRIKS